MVALCGNCHPAVAGLGEDRQRYFKDRPFNIERGFAQGALEYDKRDLLFKVGGNWYENTPVILRFHDTPLVSCKIVGGQAMVSLMLLDESLHQALVVEDNEVKFRVNDLWDFEYSHKNVVARYGPRDIAIRMDFRGDEAKVEGKVWLGNQKIELGSEYTTLPGHGVMRGCKISDSGVGLQIGDPEITLPIRCRLPEIALHHQ